MKRFRRVLIANRGEIAIRIIRACKELDIQTIAIYSKEDKNSLFRVKADEAYELNGELGPVGAYLDMDGIINLAKLKDVDAIHPGYGFLSENPEFSRKCEENGIVFIGPTYDMMNKLGDKIQSKKVADSVGVATIPGENKVVKNIDDAKLIAKKCGYPIMLKAAAGGGGRGMRIVYGDEEISSSYNSAKNEALKAFGNDDIFIEKYIENPKHIEVQLLGDNYGNLVHLYERDCSIQRRHQKVIEIAPSLNINEEFRKKIYADAKKIASAVSYRNAGTIEFLVDKNNKHYFIEMNPRIQVEHTVSEMITGIDIVQTQILIAEGYELSSKKINIKSQNDIKLFGYAIQCRVTTENPEDNFLPDTGVISEYRTSSGYGIRLDGGNGFTGAEIKPYYDSLLFKLTSHARGFDQAIKKSIRALEESTINGVKTNIPFLLNVLRHDDFSNGICNTNFIENNPELLKVKSSDDRESKLLNYLGNMAVNQYSPKKYNSDVLFVPDVKKIKTLEGSKSLLDKFGPKAVADYALSEKKLLITDTTYRDAHQSLLATRMRTKDMLKIAPAVSKLMPNLFSLEMWGGATFDVAFRYLKESPWDRLVELRKQIPNIMFQMLIRGSNGVGYKNYPDNLIKKFIEQSAVNGIDIFRIFDSLNWIEGMQLSIEEVLKQNKVAEACICYTGDILDENRDKYTLDYYVKKAKALENLGAHIIGIKDMSSLLKPMAAKKLILALKNEISIPIHLHTHDTSGNGVATVMMAALAGVDIVDCAFSSMSGLTSQPSMNSVVAALEYTDRDTKMNLDNMQKISDYWKSIRPIYSAFESDLKSSTAEIYKYEIPGGQYSNLKPQVDSFGLGDKFSEVKEKYREVNFLLGDIVKVTPSSKVVGDMAIFMVQNDLDKNNIFIKGKEIDFPDSVVSYFQGMMGQPDGGFPERLQQIVLKDKICLSGRPGSYLEEIKFDEIKEYLSTKYGSNDIEDILSYALYPKVYEEYKNFTKQNGQVTSLESRIFFEGLTIGDTYEIEIDEGKICIIKLISVGELNEFSKRNVVFEINGNRKIFSIKDNITKNDIVSNSKRYAEEGNLREIGANIPGNIIKLLVEVGDEIEEKQPLAVIEAMKMETNIISTMKGKVSKIFVKENQQVAANELIFEIE